MSPQPLPRLLVPRLPDSPLPSLHSAVILSMVNWGCRQGQGQGQGWLKVRVRVRIRVRVRNKARDKSGLGAGLEAGLTGM